VNEHLVAEHHANVDVTVFDLAKRVSREEFWIKRSGCDYVLKQILTAFVCFPLLPRWTRILGRCAVSGRVGVTRQLHRVL